MQDPAGVYVVPLLAGQEMVVDIAITHAVLTLDVELRTTLGNVGTSVLLLGDIGSEEADTTLAAANKDMLLLATVTDKLEAGLIEADVRIDTMLSEELEVERNNGEACALELEAALMEEFEIRVEGCDGLITLDVALLDVCCSVETFALLGCDSRDCKSDELAELASKYALDVFDAKFVDCERSDGVPMVDPQCLEPRSLG